MKRARLFLRSARVMYGACRADYPDVGCEQGRLASMRGALAWAWRYR